MPQIASPGTYFCKIFLGAMPPDPPSGSCPTGTRHTPTGYHYILPDYFKICGEHCLFADDTIIYCACKNLIHLERKLNHELSAVAEWRKSNQLALSIVKTSFIVFHSKK